jgi:23S rRNA (guanine745-N1)-methyltransferase
MMGVVLSDVIDRLTCPICGDDLVSSDPGQVRCSAGHVFDVARQGYVNLLPGGAKAGSADTAEMVGARAEFLRAGHFAPMADRVATLADSLSSVGCVMDAGAGPGYYLGTVLRRIPGSVGVALDLSKYAMRRAAREHPRLGAVVCDLWRPIPVRSGSADVVLNVFAPRNGREYGRMLRSGGLLLVVTPTPRHLYELVGPLGLLSVDENKRERVDASLGDVFRLDHEERCELSLVLSRPEIETLAGMGPSAHHMSAVDLRKRVAALPETSSVTASFVLSVFRAV